MKAKINTTVLAVFFVLFANLNLFAQQTSSQTEKESKAKIDVYYFHFNMRCETCRAVESEARQDVQELFGKDVSFAAYNLDETAGEKKGKELGVNSQILLVVKGNKRVDLTNEGFLYARTNPEKFKKIIEEKIKPLL